MLNFPATTARLTMPSLMKPLVLVLLSVLAAPVAAANHAKHAAQAARESLPAVTIFIDATLGMRKDSAARALTEAHVALRGARLRRDRRRDLHRERRPAGLLRHLSAGTTGEPVIACAMERGLP
jgi:hypothetical protein